MRDNYLWNLYIQCAAYVLAVLTWNGLSTLAAASTTFWGSVFIGSIYLALFAMPFWLVDVLLLRPLLKLANCSPVLCACELTTLLLNWSVIHAPGLMRSSPLESQIWRNIIITSLTLGVIYFVLSCLLHRAFNWNASKSTTA